MWVFVFYLYHSVATEENCKQRPTDPKWCWNTITECISLIKLLNSYFKRLHWSLNIDRQSDEVCDWCIKLISSLSLSSIVSALSLWLHSSGQIITFLHSFPLVPSSVSHPIPHYQMKGKPWCVWGWLAAEPEVKRWEERGRRDEGTEKEREKKKRKRRKGAACSDCKWCERRGEFVLEGWLVSVRTLWDGKWRTTIAGLLRHSRIKLELQVCLLQLLKFTLKTIGLNNRLLFAVCHCSHQFIWASVPCILCELYFFYYFFFSYHHWNSFWTI